MGHNAEIETTSEDESRRWWIPDLLVLGLVVLFAAAGVVVALGPEIERLIG